MSSAVVDLGVDPFDPSGTGAQPDALEVRPEDEVAVQRVEQWFRDYAENRDPVLRERIILSYLGLADRLAERYAPYRSARPPGPVVAVTPRRWTWWSAS